MRSGKPPRVCEPWDDDATPPEERYGELLRAARMLFGTGVTAEKTIIPTLVWAAKSCELGVFRDITDCFANAGESTEEWEELKRRFTGALGAFEPIRVVDGLLMLRWVPIAITGVVEQETGITETILIDVRHRSVKPENVAQHYDEYLRQRGIPRDASQGSVGYAVSTGVLRMAVHPEEPWAHPMGKLPIRVRREQLPFPSPQLVKGNYQGLRGSMRRGQGFSFILSGREGGLPPKGNMIPATCAWYLGRRGRLIGQPSLRPEVASLLNKHLLEPCGKPTLVEGSWIPSDTVWSTIKVVDPSILRAEHELREAYIALGLIV